MTLKRDLLRGPGTVPPGADQVGAHIRGHSAHGPRVPPLLADYLAERDAASELGQQLVTLRSWRRKRREWQSNA